MFMQTSNTKNIICDYYIFMTLKLDSLLFIELLSKCFQIQID